MVNDMSDLTFEAQKSEQQIMGKIILYNNNRNYNQKQYKCKIEMILLLLLLGMNIVGTTIPRHTILNTRKCNENN